MPLSARQSIITLALTALMSAGNALAADSLFTLDGSTDSGPLANRTFSGSFAYAANAAIGFTGDIPLSAFTLQFADQTYTLASADIDSTPVAAFANGQFLGLAYVDVDASDTAARPHVTLVPGFTTYAGEAYLSYVGAGGVGGFGDYNISVVPEPAAVLMMLAGLGVVGGMARRARRAGDQAER